MRVIAILALALFVSSSVSGSSAAQPETHRSHAIAMHGEPKVGPVSPFDFANPDAPVGGTLHRGLTGTFDSLNPFIVPGTPAAGLRDYHFPALMYRSWDEPFTMYPYVAEAIETPADRSFAVFHLNPAARWHDGTPITVEDVLFSMETLREFGTPGFRRTYGRIAAAYRVDTHAVRFDFTEDADRETPLLIALMPLLQRAWWQDRTFNETTLDIPVGAGPYRLASLDPGRRLVYERVDDWWGRTVPSFQGLFNFQTLVFDYYRDGQITLEAFRAGDTNYRFEANADQRSTNLSFPAIERGEATVITVPHGRPAGMSGFVFNTRRALFRDVRVRRALNHAFDFDFVNRTYLESDFRRSTSFFGNSELAATGLPAGRELALLETFRDRLPQALFSEPFALPHPGGSRADIRAALTLLAEAGWEVRDGILTEVTTGEPFRFEILLRSTGDERIANYLAESLSRLGIVATIRVVDSSQYNERTDTYDFDMIVHIWQVSLSPGAEQNGYWSSQAAGNNGTRNYAGVRDPVADALIDGIGQAATRDELVAHVRALDRVLQWGWYVIPRYYIGTDNIGYWGPMGYADHDPLYGMIATVDAWWWAGAAD